ncbi:hypothetical protein BJX96DRAFT_167804 [Aspergillus floccosus]
MEKAMGDAGCSIYTDMAQLGDTIYDIVDRKRDGFHKRSFIHLSSTTSTCTVRSKVYFADIGDVEMDDIIPAFLRDKSIGCLRPLFNLLILRRRLETVVPSMVGLTQVRSSNSALISHNPHFVAVFVGGTSGIGEYTAKQLANTVKQPTIHLVGRNPAAGSRIVEELKAANPNGSFNFIQSDLSLLRNVDDVCAVIKNKEDSIDLLFMTTGHLATSKKDTTEGLENNHALRYYSRMRFVQNLLPLLSASKTPGRVITVLGAGQEGQISEDNLDLQKSWSFFKSATYAATMNSLAIEHLASQYPTVSFAHVFPGIVRTPLMNSTFGSFAGSILGFLSRPFSISEQESGERNLFIATSAAYPPAGPSDPSKIGVPLPDGVQTSIASNGKLGGGSYILNYDGANATNKKIMNEYRQKDFARKVWEHTETTFKKVLGTA